MKYASLRDRCLYLMGLAPLACSGAPTVPSPPRGHGSGLSGEARVSSVPRCAPDFYRINRCVTGQLARTCRGPEMTKRFASEGLAYDHRHTEAYADKRNLNPLDACCYSGCKALDVASTGKTVPPPYANARAFRECVSVPEGGTNVPAPGDPGCPAALRIRGKAFAYSSEESRITSRGKASDKRFCCYVTGYRPRQYYRGRPLQGSEGPLLATTEDRDDWMASLPAADAEQIEPELRRRLAEGWRDHAAFEHASVAAFAKLTLDLIALGAPPHLVTASQRAGLDEVRHAQLSYALASHYAGRDVGPGPLPMEPIETPSFARLVQDTFDGGCCGETVATAIAYDALEHAGSPAVQRVLTIISRDEQRHADLGWQVLAWAVRSSEEAREMLAGLLRSETESPESASRPEPGPSASHGLVGDAREAYIEAQVMREVVRPCAEALMSSWGSPA